MEVIGARTSGIIAVHLWGRPCNIDALLDIARERNLKLIFDAAHAFGCSHQGRPIGNFGAAEVFSFHATKVVTTFEGGAVVTNDDQLAERVRLMRNFGFADYDYVQCLGTNAKLSEAGAAMGLTSLESFAQRLNKNRQWYHLYQEYLASEGAIRCVAYNESEHNNFRYVVIELDLTAGEITRDDVLCVLRAENVLARRYFFPGCHRMEPYRSKPGEQRLLSETDYVSNRVLVLPTDEAITAEAIDQICGIIRMCIKHGADLAKRLRGGCNVSASTPTE